MSYVVEPGTDPQEVRRRRRLAEALLQQGTDTSPILSPWQGAARLAQGLMGGYELGLEGRRDRDMQANAQKANQGVLSAILGGGGDAGGEGGGALPPTFTQFGTGGPSPGYVSKMLAGESKGDPNAVNPKSGATGSFQFLPSTWNGLVRQMPDKLTPDGIRDPVQQKVAMTAFTNQNGKVLSDAGFPVNDATLSLAHQQGAGGATALLKNPNANAIDVLTPLYKGNRAIATQAVVNNGGSPDMTAGQFAQKVSGYYNRQPGGGGGTQAADANRIAAMVEAINNPNFSPQYKQMAIQEIQRLRAQTQQQNDPMRQLQRQSLELDIREKQKKLTDAEQGIKPPPKMDDIISVRKEIGGLPEVKRYSEAVPAYNTMIANVHNDTAAGDIAFVYGIGKIFDPDSVVREGEMQFSQNAQSMPDKLKQTIEAVLSGKSRLTPEVKRELAQVALSRMSETEASYKERTSGYDPFLKEYGIKPELVMPVMRKSLPVPTISKTSGLTPAPGTPVPAPVAANAPPSSAAAGKVPPGVDPETWKYMTPEERALWK